MRLHTGGLSDGLPLLRHGQARLPKEPLRGRDHEPDSQPAGVRNADQHRLHGHGRASGQLRQPDALVGHPHAGMGLGLEPDAYHRVDQRSHPQPKTFLRGVEMQPCHQHAQPFPRRAPQADAC